MEGQRSRGKGQKENHPKPGFIPTVSSLPDLGEHHGVPAASLRFFTRRTNEARFPISYERPDRALRHLAFGITVH